MWAFIIAGIVFLITVAIAFVIGYAQGMADAPVYDNTPLHVLIGGTILSILIILSHWFPHLGW